MPRNYQVKKNNKYYMPHDLYMRIQYIIKGYDRLKREYTDIVYMPIDAVNSSSISKGQQSPIQDKTVKIAHICAELDAIEQSTAELKTAYFGKVHEDIDILKAYWNYDYFNYIYVRNESEVVEGEEAEDDYIDEGPSRRTWNYFKVVLAGLIAKKMMLF